MKTVVQQGVRTCVISLIFCCFSCNGGLPDHVKIAGSVTAQVAEHLKEVKQLDLIGTGGRMMDDIQMMSMSFNCYQKLDLEEARSLLVYSVQKYLSEINCNEQIRPYLHEYPATAKNVQIWIFIYKPDGSNPEPGDLYSILAIEGKLTYNVREQGSRITIRTESYEEALCIVNASKSK